MLKNIKELFDTFRKSETFKTPEGYYDISSMLRGHWSNLGFGFVSDSLVSVLLGWIGNMIFQCSRGWLEEINIITSEMERLLASDSDKKVQKINVSKTSNSTDKSLNDGDLKLSSKKIKAVIKR